MGLSGKRVLVTRAREQASVFVDALMNAGALPIVIPAIRLAPPADGGLFSDMVAKAADYDWIIFTSVNGVEGFFGERFRQKRDSADLRKVRFAVIGPATAEALAGYGFLADVVPDEYRGEAVAEAIKSFQGEDLNGVSFLLPRAAGARAALPDLLRDTGARVDVVEAYQITPADPKDAERLLDLLQRRELDVATFTSSSTVSNTVRMLGERALPLLEPLTVASIGPVTTETAVNLGLRVDVTAEKYTIRGLVDALEAHFSRI